jgi:coatomer protein complex subunit gamma
MLLRFLLTEAVGNIVKFLGMHPCERSDKVPDNKNTHTLLLAGKQHLWSGRPG